MTRRHELDPISLTFGLLFTGLGLLFLIGQADQALRLKWVWPLLLLAIGAAILVDVTRGRDRTDQELESPPQPEIEPDTGPRPDPTPTERTPEDRVDLVDPVDNREQRS
jgi:hypothetical protein